MAKTIDRRIVELEDSDAAPDLETQFAHQANPSIPMCRTEFRLVLVM
jgi:hypothetical protein